MSTVASSTLCVCGRLIDDSASRGVKRLYCSPACKQLAYRNKKASEQCVTVSVTINDRVTPQDIKPILKYPGAKWARAEWIVSLLPEHKQYLEPYCGSAAIYLNKKPCGHEIINDINGSIVNLFRILRTRPQELIDLLMLTPWSRDEYNASYDPCDDELESARRFMVRCWQAHGTRLNGKTGWRHRGPSSGGSTTSLWKQLPDRIQAVVSRLRDAEIENKPALDIIAEYPQALIYADPPYELSTRSGALYADEMDTDAHSELLEVLDKHAGPVVLSGYACPLYDERLAHWQRVTMPSLAESGKVRTEVLWLNAKAARRQLNLFDEVTA